MLQHIQPLASVLDSIQKGVEVGKDFFLTLGIPGKIILVLLIIWIGKFIAKMISKGVQKALENTSIDDKLARKLGHDAGVSKAIASFVFAFCMLFVLIFALSAAELKDAAEPLQGAFSDVIGFVLNLALAGIFAYVVVMLANIIKSLLGDVLKAAKLDQRLGSTDGSTPIADAIVIAAYSFFILLFTPAILDVLGIKEVSEPIGNIVDQILNVIPQLIGAGVLIFVGVLVANIARELIVNVLKATKVDEFPAKLGLNLPTSGSKSVSGVVGLVVMASIMVFIITTALNIIELEILQEAAAVIQSGYFSVLLAVVILGIGLLGAKFAFEALEDKNLMLAKIARVVIIIFSAVVALNRSGLAPQLTDLPYMVALYAVGFAVGVGGAIALGLGAREAVSRYLDKKVQ